MNMLSHRRRCNRSCLQGHLCQDGFDRLSIIDRRRSLVGAEVSRPAVEALSGQRISRATFLYDSRIMDSAFMGSQPTSTASRPARAPRAGVPGRLRKRAGARFARVPHRDSTPAFLDPQSSTGTFELTLRSELDAARNVTRRPDGGDVRKFADFFWSPKVDRPAPGPHLYVAPLRPPCRAPTPAPGTT